MAPEIRRDGRPSVFRTDGMRFAVGASREHRSLIFSVFDPAGHPCDVGPLALVGAGEVRELRDALGAWLDEECG